MAKSSLSRRSSGTVDPLSAQTLERDWSVLCTTIGERRAGTPAEQAAATYIAEEFRKAGIEDTRLETFPCISMRDPAADVFEQRGRRWHRVDATPVVGAPATPGRFVEGDLAWIELPEQAHRLRPRSLRGRVLAMFGPMPTELSLHRRLLAAEPIALIHVDERLPFGWTKNDGVYPYWARAHGMLPTLTVPYLEAWRWRRDDVRRVRVRVAVRQVEGTSQNVIATLPGTNPKLPALVLAAHHDTQGGNPGADDNASGVVCLLALARLFGRRRFARSLRFCSFGTEEQLSVGSAAHVRGARLSNRDVGLVINYDSVASPLGHWQLMAAGPQPMIAHVARHLTRVGFDPAVTREVTPFADQFPFNRVGIPSIMFARVNTPAGRWQHHGPYDTLENVSTTVVQDLLRASGSLIRNLAATERWPFPSKLPAAESAAARRLGRELFGW